MFPHRVDTTRFSPFFHVLDPAIPRAVYFRVSLNPKDDFLTPDDFRAQLERDIPTPDAGLGIVLAACCPLDNRGLYLAELLVELLIQMREGGDSLDWLNHIRIMTGDQRTLNHLLKILETKSSLNLPKENVAYGNLFWACYGASGIWTCTATNSFPVQKCPTCDERAPGYRPEVAAFARHCGWRG